MAAAAVEATPREAPGPAPDGPASLAVLLAGLTAAAGVIHVAMVPIHAASGLTEPLGFAIAAWAQLWVAAVLATGRAGSTTIRTSVLVNVAALALWAWSRTVGLPFGDHAGQAEAVGAVDAVTAGLQGAAVLCALALTVAPDRWRSARLAPTLGAVAALGLATAVIVSPDAASHHHGAVAAAGATAGGHDHGTSTGSDAAHLAEMALVDEVRCDQSFNPVAYWHEARILGVDTYGGGTMSAHTHAAADSVVGAVAQREPFGGRGSAQLDELISLTDQAAGGEGAAASLVVALSESGEGDYQAWLGWLRAMSTSDHAHTAGAGDDTGGHGGHVGPQPWKAMVDRSECARLDGELGVARRTALEYPTVADAEAAGWEKVTEYVPGIAAHYMKYDLVDGTFAVDEPEMLLYDGTRPDSRIVGVSYYLLHEGSSEPTQGFTGGNDHFHRHIGLCSRGGVVIGDSTTTPEQCAAMGGRKQGGSAGWMSHAWVVPGCESPWGVFSAASPLFDRDLTEASGGDGACAASGARERYDLAPATRETVTSPPEYASGPR